jgi:hypothetical protein
MNPQDFTSIPALLGTMDEKLNSLIEYRRDHEVRIKSLEVLATQAKSGWKIIIFLASISSAVGAAVTWLLQHFKP